MPSSKLIASPQIFFFEQTVKLLSISCQQHLVKKLQIPTCNKKSLTSKGFSGLETEFFSITGEEDSVTAHPKTGWLQPFFSLSTNTLAYQGCLHFLLITISVDWNINSTGQQRAIQRVSGSHVTKMSLVRFQQHQLQPESGFKGTQFLLTTVRLNL